MYPSPSPWLTHNWDIPNKFIKNLYRFCNVEEPILSYELSIRHIFNRIGYHEYHRYCNISCITLCFFNTKVIFSLFNKSSILHLVANKVHLLRKWNNVMVQAQYGHFERRCPSLPHTAWMTHHGLKDKHSVFTRRSIICCYKSMRALKMIYLVSSVGAYHRR